MYKDDVASGMYWYMECDIPFLGASAFWIPHKRFSGIGTYVEFDILYYLGYAMEFFEAELG